MVLTKFRDSVLFQLPSVIGTVAFVHVQFRSIFMRHIHDFEYGHHFKYRTDPQAAVLRGLNSIQHAKHSVISLNYNFTAHLWPSLQQALYMLDPEVFN